MNRKNSLYKTLRNQKIDFFRISELLEYNTITSSIAVTLVGGVVFLIFALSAFFINDASEPAASVGL